jgi:AbrB family looped-hinge helix DNA binding protein
MNHRYEAKITSKGQLTLPREIRRALGVGPGDQVAFELTERGVQVWPVHPPGAFHRLAGRWREGEGMTIEEINAWLRDIRGHNEPDL